MTIKTIGLDPREERVSGAWRRRDRRHDANEAVTSQADVAFLFETAAMPNRGRGMWNRPSLGPHARCHGS